MFYSKSLLLLVCVCSCYGHTLKDEPNQILRLFEADTDLPILSTPVKRSVQTILNLILDRVHCVQQGLSNHECSECFSASAMMKLSSLDDTKSTTQVTDMTQLSVILAHHVTNLKRECAEDGDRCYGYGGCRDEFLGRFAVDGKALSENKLLESIEEVLRNVKAVYNPLHRQQCFSAERLLQEYNGSEYDSQNEKFENIMRLMVGHVLKGDCIDVGDAVTDFIEYLFVEYGDKCAKVITRKGVEKMLSDLKNPPDLHSHHGHSHSDHSHNHNNHHNHDHDHSHHNRDGCHEDRHADHDHNHDDHGHNHDHDHDHNHDHNHDHLPSAGGHYHYPYTTASSTLNSNAFSSSISTTENNLHRTTRNENKSRQERSVIKQAKNGAEIEHEHTSLAEKCFDADMLIQRFGQSPFENISRSEFLQLCPALIQQTISGVCKKNSSRVSARPTKTELYGYSSLAVFVISLCALGGIFLLPIMAKKAYHYVMMGFIGLSFGTMAGDSLLHLIPQAVGLHSHDSESHGVDIGVTFDNIPFYLWKQLGVLGAIYCLFLFETIMELISDKDKHEGSQGHGHSHIPDKIPEEIRLKSVSHKTESTTNLANAQSQNNVSLSIDGLSPDSLSSQPPVFKSTALCCGLTSLAMVVTLGDAVHNFGDGLAIGAAFSSGLQGGLSTSLAVFCHELPHEFGDFVVLVSTGLSFWKALLVNFISALFCFVGLYIGIQLGENEVARSWILTATAGIFLYVALADMLPELKQAKHGAPLKMLLVKNLGVLAGIGIMLVIAIYEDHFHI